MIMLELVISTLRVTLFGVSGIFLGLITDILPKSPVTNDPLAWAYMSAVTVVLLCALWVVWFVMTTYVKKLDDVVSKLTDVIVEQRLLRTQLSNYLEESDE